MNVFSHFLQHCQQAFSSSGAGVDHSTALEKRWEQMPSSQKNSLCKDEGLLKLLSAVSKSRDLDCTAIVQYLMGGRDQPHQLTSLQEKDKKDSFIIQPETQDTLRGLMRSGRTESAQKTRHKLETLLAKLETQLEVLAELNVEEQKSKESLKDFLSSTENSFNRRELENQGESSSTNPNLPLGPNLSDSDNVIVLRRSLEKMVPTNRKLSVGVHTSADSGLSVDEEDKIWFEQSLSHEPKAERDPMDLNEFSANLFKALDAKNSDAVRKLCDAHIQPSDKHALMAALSEAQIGCGSPAFIMALKRGDKSSAMAYVELLQSKLSPTLIFEFLSSIRDVSGKNQMLALLKNPSTRTLALEFLKNAGITAQQLVGWMKGMPLNGALSVSDADELEGFVESLNHLESDGTPMNLFDKNSLFKDSKFKDGEFGDATYKALQLGLSRGNRNAMPAVARLMEMDGVQPELLVKALTTRVAPDLPNPPLRAAMQAERGADAIGALHCLIKEMGEFNSEQLLSLLAPAGTDAKRPSQTAFRAMLENTLSKKENDARKETFKAYVAMIRDIAPGMNSADQRKLYKYLNSSQKARIFNSDGYEQLKKDKDLYKDYKSLKGLLEQGKLTKTQSLLA